MSGGVTTPVRNLRAPWVIRYLAELTLPRLVLWCYLIWYGFVLVRYFDPSARLWLSSLGISAIIGIALYLSVREPGKSPPDRWTTMRLFLMPFCVSSFSQLIKGKGFVLVFPPDLHEIAISLGACAAFVLLVWSVRRVAR